MPWTVYNSDGKVLQSAEVGSNSITNAKMADDAIDSAEIADGAIDLVHMSSQSVDEDNLYISNAGSNGEFLSKQSGNSGGLTWAAATSTAPVFGRFVRTAGAISTTSLSLVDVTGATVTMTTGAFPVYWSVTNSFIQTNINGNAYFNIDIDGTLQHGSAGVYHIATENNLNNAMSLNGLSVALSAASHTIKVQYRVGAGTLTLSADASSAFMFTVHEIR